MKFLAFLSATTINVSVTIQPPQNYQEKINKIKINKNSLKADLFVFFIIIISIKIMANMSISVLGRRNDQPSNPSHEYYIRFANADSSYGFHAVGGILFLPFFIHSVHAIPKVALLNV